MRVDREERFVTLVRRLLNLTVPQGAVIFVLHFRRQNCITFNYFFSKLCRQRFFDLATNFHILYRKVLKKLHFYRLNYV